MSWKGKEKWFLPFSLCAFCEASHVFSMWMTTSICSYQVRIAVGANMKQILCKEEDRLQWVIQTSQISCPLPPCSPWDNSIILLRLEKCSPCKHTVLDFSFIFSQVDLLSFIILFCYVSRDTEAELSFAGVPVDSCIHNWSSLAYIMFSFIQSVSQRLPALRACSQFLHLLLGFFCWLPVTKDSDKWIQHHLLGLTEGLDSFWNLLLPKLIALKLIMLRYPLKNRPRWGKYPS